MLEKPTGAGGMKPVAPRDDGSLMLSVPDAARLLGVGTTLCWELVRAGTLPSVRLGRRVVIPRVAVERLAQVEGTSHSR